MLQVMQERLVDLFTISEAAKRMHVSRQTIYTWIQEGRIRPLLTPGGRSRIPEDQLILAGPGVADLKDYGVYKIRDISNLEPVLDEPMGTKEKYWFSRTTQAWYWPDLGSQYAEFIFKAGRSGTGENWAEKIAAELCAWLGLPHASYDMAIYKNKRGGVISPTFVPQGASLRHGNEILASFIPEYEKSQRYHQSQYSVKTVISVLSDEKIRLPLGWQAVAGIDLAADVFAGYLMLDAWIANTDRHHENWGLIVDPQGKKLNLAPTFDHASSFGCNITDDERWERLKTRDFNRSVGYFVSRARSAFFLDQADRKPLSTLEVFQLAAKERPAAAHYWLDKLAGVAMDEIESVILNIPGTEMSEVAKEFSWTVLELNRQRLLDRIL
jgi:excisionase family DNA binding protein